MASNTVAIVCGYDIHTDLRDYANRFQPFLSHCDLVILSGGCTSPVTDESEAHALSMLIAGEDTGAPHPRIVLEEESMTTLDNIVLSREMAGHVTQYVVICDRVHAVKVMVLAAILLRVRFAVCAVRRKVPLRVMLFEPFSVIAETLAALFPVLRPALRRGAMRWKGLRTARSPRSVPQATA